MHWLIFAVALAGCATSEAEAVPEVEPATGGLRINEIAAAGTPSDWFEVVNTSDEPIELGAHVFVDGKGELTRARSFAAQTLGPGELHVEEVTKKTAGFALGKSDGLRIYRGGVLVDSVTWAAGASPRGGSYARDAAGEMVTVRLPTRGLPNP